MELCAARPELYSDTVSAIRTPEGFDATRIVTHAADTYGVAFGVGLGEVAGKVFRIGHLGMLTDVLALSGIATAEMAMADLGLDHARLRRRRRAGGLSQHRHAVALAAE
jgi:alanine-glyoxylate transaminase/serine-glyoxylate transaminase/serine-pyruvate transaminase